MSKSPAEKTIEALDKKGIKPFHEGKIKMRRNKDLEKFLKEKRRLEKLPMPNIRFGMAT